MIITKIRIQEENPMTNDFTSWPVPFCDLHLTSAAGENGYLLKDAPGLDPPDINEVAEGFDIYGTPGLVDIPEMREITFKIGLNPGSDQTFGQMRDYLYTFLSKVLLISLMDGSKTVAVAVGHIRRFESITFTNKPFVQITVQCKHGLFYQPSSNDIPISEIDSFSPLINYNDGTGPTGIDLQFTVDVPTAWFQFSDYGRVRNLSTDPVSNLFRVTYPLIVNDTVTISTFPRERKIILTRGGVDIDLAGYLNAGAVWPMLFPGVNAFNWTITPAWATYEYARYVPRYWGV